MRLKTFLTLALLLASCAAEKDDVTSLTAGGDQILPEQAEPAPLGVGEVDGLPGTPLEYSSNGLPIIEGVERPDYADTGINSMEKRRERVTKDNPTGEYRFNIDELGPNEWVADADDLAGFRNSMEEYTWRLTHTPRTDIDKGTFRSEVFHGKAFSRANGVVEARGACWLKENAGLDCEFPTKKLGWKLRDYFADNFAGDCNSPPSDGGLLAPVGDQPARFLQAGADLWKPEATITVSRDVDKDEISAYCEDLPGSHFGGIMGRSGGFGDTIRRVTNAKGNYPNCPGTNGQAAFPRGMFTYAAGDLKYDPINLYERGILCNANTSDPRMLANASTNMFAHEIGHILGFAHFSTGVMQTGGDCNLFYSQIRSLPAAFHTAMARFIVGTGDWKFANGDSCISNAILPTPTDNSSNFPFGRLFE